MARQWSCDQDSHGGMACVLAEVFGNVGDVCHVPGDSQIYV